MDELLRQAQTILRAMWKHRRLGVLVAWLAGAIGAGVVLSVPDKYEASARIFVDTQSMLKPLMSGLAVQPNVEQQVMMLSRTLISRPNVEKLIRMADLDLGSKSKAAQDDLAERLIKALEIKSTSRDNLYTLSYRDSNPDKAKRVVQSLVSIFVESSLGDSRKDTDSAKRFIETQIKAYEQKLEEAENRLKEFKLRNIELQTADGKSSTDRLSTLIAQLSAAKLELREAENSRDALKSQVAGETPVLLPEAPGIESTIALPEIDSRIDAMKRNLDSLLQKFTDQHPDVIGTRRVIKELEEQKRRDLLARNKVAVSNPTATISSNPVYQQLKVSLGEAEANVASLRARVAEYEARYSRAKDAMRTMPQIEAEFSQLNRDYDIQKKSYEALVARRESASLTGDLDTAAGVAEFRLIDPPRVSPKPVAPNRMLLLAAALLVSLVVGIAVSFIASQVRAVFHDGRSLREFSGLPVLGIVSLVESESLKLKERRSLKRFLIALAGLFGAYGMGLAALYWISLRAT